MHIFYIGIFPKLRLVLWLNKRRTKHHDSDSWGKGNLQTHYHFWWLKGRDFCCASVQYISKFFDFGTSRSVGVFHSRHFIFRSENYGKTGRNTRSHCLLFHMCKGGSPCDDVYAASDVTFWCLTQTSPRSSQTEYMQRCTGYIQQSPGGHQPDCEQMTGLSFSAVAFAVRLKIV